MSCPCLVEEACACTGTYLPLLLLKKRLLGIELSTAIEVIGHISTRGRSTIVVVVKCRLSAHNSSIRSDFQKPH